MVTLPRINMGITKTNNLEDIFAGFGKQDITGGGLPSNTVQVAQIVGSAIAPIIGMFGSEIISNKGKNIGNYWNEISKPWGKIDETSKLNPIRNIDSFVNDLITQINVMGGNQQAIPKEINKNINIKANEYKGIANKEKHEFLTPIPAIPFDVVGGVEAPQERPYDVIGGMTKPKELLTPIPEQPFDKVGGVEAPQERPYDVIGGMTKPIPEQPFDVVGGVEAPQERPYDVIGGMTKPKELLTPIPEQPFDKVGGVETPKDGTSIPSIKQESMTQTNTKTEQIRPVEEHEHEKDKGLPTIPNIPEGSNMEENVQQINYNNLQDVLRYLDEKQKEQWEREDAIRLETQQREDSAYQRAVNDMRKSGVNPNLVGVNPAESGGGITQATGMDYSLYNAEVNKYIGLLQTELNNAFKEDENTKDRITDIIGGLINSVGWLIGIGISSKGKK